jgi:hypothetical protein
MAPEIHMPEPLCLIGSTEGHLVTNQEALKILSAITQPVVVVAIVGLYRTGKSYLMNKLAGKEKGEYLQCLLSLLQPHRLSTSSLGCEERKSGTLLATESLCLCHSCCWHQMGDKGKLSLSLSLSL